MAGAVLTVIALVATVPAGGRTVDSISFTFAPLPLGWGTVTLLPYNITCPPQCSQEVPSDTDLLLIAKPIGGFNYKEALLSGPRGVLQVSSTTYLRATPEWIGYGAYMTTVKQKDKPRPPLAMRNLTADTTEFGTVTLRWGRMPATSGDVIRRRSGTSCPRTVLDGEYLGTGSYTHPGVRGWFADATVTPGAQYCYGVFALQDGFPSAPAVARVIVPTVSTVTPPPTVTTFFPSAGSAGTLVKIRGQHLLATTAVRFGGVEAETFWPESAAVLDVVVPFIARTATITVETPTGAATSANVFTVPTPTITSFEPAQGHVGDEVRIRGTRFDLANTIYFGRGAASHDVLSKSLMVARVPPDGTSGPLTVSSIAGTGVSSSSFTILR